MDGHAEVTPADQEILAADEPDPPCDVVRPQRQTAPLVFASPHSGSHYPASFIAASRLDPVTLRRSEDAFVDEIFAVAPELGAPLLRAHFPRAYVDPNREPYELDPAMFADPLPADANTRSPRVVGGLGTIARVVTNGQEIYRGKLRAAEALRRIEALYRPYHATLAALVSETRRKFGHCIVIDCHSMPSVGGPMDRDPGTPRVDFVLGDRHRKSCAAVITETAEASLRAFGYRVARNTPYAGGFTTVHYGTPAERVHALQIEINRALYMDEEKVTRGPGLARLAREIRDLVLALSRIPSGRLATKTAASR